VVGDLLEVEGKAGKGQGRAAPRESTEVALVARRIRRTQSGKPMADRAAERRRPSSSDRPQVHPARIRAVGA